MKKKVTNTSNLNVIIIDDANFVDLALSRVSWQLSTRV